MRFHSKQFLLSIIFFATYSTSYAFDHQHSSFSEVLHKYVKMSHSSQVNYQGLKKDPTQLNNYLKVLSKLSQKDFKAFKEAEQISFLINAYNAFTLKLVIDNYPVKSIRKIGGFFSSPWKIEFIDLLGEKISLDKIEHEMLRKNYKEPRIHFAVNCASIGCPRLLNQAYTSKNLDKQLNEQAVAFTDTNRNSIDWNKRSIVLSKIFSWFEDDFLKSNKSVQDFVLKYMLSEPEKRNQVKQFEIEYSKYDWDLNGL